MRAYASPLKGKELCVQKVKHSLLACHTRRKCLFEISRKSVKVGIGVMVINLGAPLHTLSKLYDVPVGFVSPLF